MTDPDGDRAGANSRSLLRSVRESLRLSRRAAPTLFACAVVVPLLQAVLLLGQILLVGLLAGVFFGPSTGPVDLVRDVATPAGLILGCLVAVLVLDNVQTIVRELLTERVRQVCARRMHEAISRLELVDFEYPETHDLVQRASTTDFRPAQVVRGLTGLLGSLLRITVLTAAVVAIVPLLVPLLLALAVPVLLVARGQAADRHSFATRLTPLERRRLYFNRLLTAREPAGENRAYALTDHFAQRFDDLSDQREAELATMLGGQWRRMVLGQLLFVVVVAGAALAVGWLFTSGLADGSALVAAAVGLVQVAALISALGFPASEIAEAGLFLGDQHEFLRRIELAEQNRTAGATVPPLESLELRDVSFAYPASSRSAVQKVSLTVRRGQLVALVGPNGSGKSTLAKILGSLYAPDAGTVLWNGVDIAELDLAARRARVATMMQDFETYSETISDSVALGAVDEPVDPVRVADALAVAGFTPGELDPDRLIGPEHDGGTALSGGQRQRLAIARALYRRADLLILDEPTSSLDARAEHGLLAELRRRGCTTVLISHRLANVAHADHIVVFGEGRVLAEGDHAQLMAEGGLYHELYTLQASLYSSGEAEVSISFTGGPSQAGEQS